ncbi:hypothetical protein W97_00456 [Coniosporium apollinis CBS 100218]|uniref:Thiamine-triphosphatase n=1 Tax=Coniosporium apollinis (strain CBS 100218) TaxID=1168221 RepID=R7YH76_CONA1|nr:uncharacterized protein W97_00456 [Coniosporium apollinis CBS 100218]EON61243.1 hypothetical protein W97_00456 [Coniosporium apollinis CBS 100218]
MFPGGEVVGVTRTLSMGSEMAEHLQGTTTDEQRPFWRHANITAELHTTRYGWQIDDAFNVVIDCVSAEKHNFRHWVGEVELVKTVESSSEEGLLEAKRMAAARMDEEIQEFMERYSWAFSADKPVGKLSAFLALKRLRKA